MSGPDPETPLTAILRARIEDNGPLPVDEWMAACLADENHGYYRTADPLGRGGDFTTSPEISQMFGELVGLWAAVVWSQMGAPTPIRLIEAGPGRGTLMADALRALNGAPEMRAALSVDLVEISPILRKAQEQSLASTEVPISWHIELGKVPAGPCVFVANEYLDALPIRQLIRHNNAWRERMVTWNEGVFAYVAGPAVDVADIPSVFHDAPEGAIFETSPAVDRAVRDIAQRMVDGPGAALIIDYGHLSSGLGDTLQAVQRHAFADPLAHPGQSDLTAHVDFARVADIAREMGARVWGGISQAALLERLGLSARTAALLTNATQSQAADISAARDRLTSPDGMGHLFKALAITGPDQPAPPGFEEVSLR